MDRAGFVGLDAPEKVLGTSAKVVGTIGPEVCYGQLYFRKISSGDTVYIGLGNKVPSATDYHIILTDAVPAWSGLAAYGQINAIGSATDSKLSSFSVQGNYK